MKMLEEQNVIYPKINMFNLFYNIVPVRKFDVVVSFLDKSILSLLRESRRFGPMTYLTKKKTIRPVTNKTFQPYKNHSAQEFRRFCPNLT